MTSKDQELIAEAYGTVYRGEKTERDSKDYSNVADEELGPDPKEADELEAIMKKHKPEYESTPFWDAYTAVKDGLWSEDEFVQWSRSVWADGANEGSTPR